MNANRKCHDPRIIQARKHYKAHLKHGMPEKVAWTLFLQTQRWILEELKIRRSN